MPQIVEEIIPSVYATDWPDGFKGQDLRPRLVDGFKVKYLVDSGSMTCVVPRNPVTKLTRPSDFRLLTGALSLHMGEETFRSN